MNNTSTRRNHFTTYGTVKVEEISAGIFCSYGFDGSRGQSTFKEKFNKTGNYSDASLRLQSGSHSVVLNNRTSKSVLFYRQLKLA